MRSNFAFSDSMLCMLRGLRQAILYSAVLPDRTCRRCRPGVFRRLNRSSLLERTVFTWLGFYPWECVTCRRKRFFRRQRQDNESPSGVKRAEA